MWVALSHEWNGEVSWGGGEKVAGGCCVCPFACDFSRFVYWVGSG